MKLIIQIPCYNEERTLPATLADLPKSIPGIDVIEYLVIDDGSQDATASVARAHGVHHVLELETNRGLGCAFAAGVEYALEQGADILVNTDGDNQYAGGDIPKLIAPILERRADVVVGCRPIVDHPEFGAVKKSLQLLGSKTVRYISKTNIRDAASGFRAISKEAAMRLYVMSAFSYCMETLIQAGNSGLRVKSVDVAVNSKTRPSRLFKTVPEYLYRSTANILAMFLLYRPGRFFFFVGSLFNFIALILGCRFLFLVYFAAETSKHRTYLPSLIFLSIMVMIGFISYMLGIVGEILKGQRIMLSELIYRQRREKYGR